MSLIQKNIQHRTIICFNLGSYILNYNIACYAQYVQSYIRCIYFTTCMTESIHVIKFVLIYFLLIDLISNLFQSCRAITFFALHLIKRYLLWFTYKEYGLISHFVLQVILFTCQYLSITYVLRLESSTNSHMEFRYRSTRSK